MPILIRPYNGGNFGGQGARPNAVAFDGSTNYLVKSSISGISTSTKFTLSLWVDPDTDGSTSYLLRLRGNGAAPTAPGRLHIERTSSGYISLFAQRQDTDASVITILSASTTTAISASGGWKNVLISLDLSDSAKRHVYINDAADSTTWTTYRNFSMVLADVNNNSIGGSYTGTNKFSGGISELWFDTDTYIDFSVEANRRKFINSTGFATPLGSTGAIPTGSSPDIYQTNPATTYGANSGTGGDWTVHGTLTDTAGPP